MDHLITKNSRIENQDSNDVTLVTNEKNIKKCYYFNKGYCKFKNKCKYYHPTCDCQNKCENRKTCTKRHRRLCKYNDKCYFKQSNICEFLHIDVTLAAADNKQNEAHKVILAVPNTNTLKEKKSLKEIELLKHKIYEQTIDCQNLEIEKETLKLTAEESKLKYII